METIKGWLSKYMCVMCLFRIAYEQKPFYSGYAKNASLAKIGADL